MFNTSDVCHEPLQILIVEDDARQSDILTECLMTFGGFMITRTDSIGGLWQNTEKQSFDLILLDNQLPDGSGIRALEDLKKDREIPIIMLTSQGDEQLALKAMQLGAANYLVKSSEYTTTLPTLIQKAVKQHQLQLSIRHSLEQLRYQALLLNNVRDAVVVWNTEGNITYWNPAAERLIGLQSVECLGKHVEDCYLNIFIPPVSKPEREETNGQEIERRISRNGKTIWVSSKVTALRDFGMDGRLIGFMDITRDISERKIMEAQIHATQIQLTETARLAAIGDLASEAAHHILNPLTTIIAETQLLLDIVQIKQPGRESIEAIEKAGWRIQQVIQKLVEFSRPLKEPQDHISINETIENALKIMRDTIISNDVNLVINLDNSLPYMVGNAQKLVVLWMNLLILARDGTTGKSTHTINVNSHMNDHSISIDIHDDGKLIPLEEIDKISDPTLIKTLGGRGMGIELNICQEIIRQHQAKLVVESNPKNGTTFQVNFPLEEKHGTL